jgi:uncharacterized DUF497 family protein
VFEWDPEKEKDNLRLHGVDFRLAKKAFDDPKALVFFDRKHSRIENRYFCIGCVDGAILTVRFTVRNSKIRIFGAGFWRKQRGIYYEKNKDTK